MFSRSPQIEMGNVRPGKRTGQKLISSFYCLQSLSAQVVWASIPGNRTTIYYKSQPVVDRWPLIATTVVIFRQRPEGKCEWKQLVKPQFLASQSGNFCRIRKCWLSWLFCQQIGFRLHATARCPPGPWTSRSYILLRGTFTLLSRRYQWALFLTFLYGNHLMKKSATSGGYGIRVEMISNCADNFCRRHARSQKDQSRCNTVAQTTLCPLNHHEYATMDDQHKKKEQG